MRYLSPVVKQLLLRDDASSFYLVKIQAPGALLMETTLSYQVSVPGLGTFSADGGLLKVESPRLSDVVDRETYKIAFADPQFEKIALFESVITGSPVSVHVGFMNTTDDVLADTNPGMPILNIDHMIVAYRGVVDTQGYSIDPVEGSVVAMVECSSPVAALGMTRGFKTSQESMKRFSATDTSFNQVFASGSKLPWGKA